MASKNKIFLDANMLIEILHKRERSSDVESLMYNLVEKAYISVLTAHSVVHFTPKGLPMYVVRRFLDDFIVLDLCKDDFEWAFDNKLDDDFEDALQLAIAVRNGCEEFITLDKQLAETYGRISRPKIRLL